MASSSFPGTDNDDWTGLRWCSVQLAHGFEVADAEVTKEHGTWSFIA